MERGAPAGARRRLRGRARAAAGAAGAIGAREAAARRRDDRGRFASSDGSARSILTFLRVALVPGGEHSSLDIGEVGGRSPAAFHGFSRRIHSGTVAHALKRHGDRAVEATRGQLPITRADVARVPLIVAHAHEVQIHGASAGGRGQSVRYTACIAGREYSYVETVGAKRRQLVFKTMWKR